MRGAPAGSPHPLTKGIPQSRVDISAAGYYPSVMKNIILTLLVSILIAGCGATSGLIQKNDQEDLAKSTDFYYKFILWKYYEKAAQYVDPEKLRQYESFVLRNEKDLNITGYEIKEIVYLVDDDPGSKGDAKDADACVVRVLYSYYKYPSVSEKTVMVEDTWIRINKFWYISSDYEKGTFN